jgi:hypothetical protein
LTDINGLKTDDNIFFWYAFFDEGLTNIEFGIVDLNPNFAVFTPFPPKKYTSKTKN